MKSNKNSIRFTTFLGQPSQSKLLHILITLASSRFYFEFFWSPYRIPFRHTFDPIDPLQNRFGTILSIYGLPVSSVIHRALLLSNEQI